MTYNHCNLGDGHLCMNPVYERCTAAGVCAKHCYCYSKSNSEIGKKGEYRLKRKAMYDLAQHLDYNYTITQNFIPSQKE